MTRIAGLIAGRSLFLLLALLLIVGGFGTALAQQDAPAEDGTDRLIADGRLVYEANCAGCHNLGRDGPIRRLPATAQQPRRGG